MSILNMAGTEIKVTPPPFTGMQSGNMESPVFTGSHFLFMKHRLHLTSDIPGIHLNNYICPII
jgi:hypothetical protein